MRAALIIASLTVALGSAACGKLFPLERQVTVWDPARIAFPPGRGVARPVGGQRDGGKFSLRFYEKLKAHARIAPLAAVDVWELRDHPRRYDVITIGPVPVSQYTGRKELLDDLAVTHGLTKEKADVFTNWVKTGGIVWIEYGVVVQGYEWTRGGARDAGPRDPDLAGFTMFGLPTHALVFEATRAGAFAVEPKTFAFRNEAQHPATVDIRSLRLIQSSPRTSYLIITGDPDDALVREGDTVYATVVGLGQGKIVSTLPFDSLDPATDGEKYRINLEEWLAGHPIPGFDPRLDVERLKD